MRCGMYECDITPKLGSWIPGYYTIRIGAGVLDPLMTKAIVFTDDDDSTFVMIVIDAINVHPEVCAMTRRRVHELTGIAPERVMMSATHSHTGGPLSGSDTYIFNAEYAIWVAERSAEAVALAYANRQPVKIGYGKTTEETISFVRRYRMKDGSFTSNPGFGRDDIECPTSQADPEVTVVKIEDLNGKLLGVITNFACHLDTVGGYRFSADYPGELSRVLKAVYGQDIVSLFLTGACGNINHLDFMHRPLEYYTKANPPHHVRMGRILAGDVIRVLADVETKEGGSVAVANDTFVGHIRTPSEETVAKAKAILEKTPYRHEFVHEWEEQTRKIDMSTLFECSNAESLLMVAEIKDKDIDIPVQAARVGDIAITGMPCELFTEFGVDIKARSGFDCTLIATLCNRPFGYIATRESFDQGGYETAITHGTRMGPDTGYDMSDTAVRLMQGLK